MPSPLKIVGSARLRFRTTSVSMRYRCAPRRALTGWRSIIQLPRISRIIRNKTTFRGRSAAVIAEHLSGHRPPPASTSICRRGLSYRIIEYDLCFRRSGRSRRRPSLAPAPHIYEVMGDHGSPPGPPHASEKTRR